MAAVLTGTPEALSLGGGQHPTPVNATVPADCTAVYIFTQYYAGAGFGISSITLGGNSPDEAFTVATAGGDQVYVGVHAFYNPSTGSQAVDISWATIPSAGPLCVVAYVKDGDTTAWRDADGGNESGATTLSVSLTTDTDDLVLKWNYRYQGLPGTSAGWTSAQTQTVSTENARLSSIVASGATTVCDAEDENYAALVAIAIAPAAAGSESTVQPGSNTVSLETDAPTLLRDIVRAAGATATVTAETDAPNVFALATPAAADIDVTTGTLTLNGVAALNPGEATVSVAVTAPTAQASVDIATAEILASGTQIRLTTNEAITAAINDGGGSDFTLTMTGGAVTMAYHSGLPGTTHLYNLSRTISSDETGTLDYTQPGNGLEATADGEDVRSVTALVVDNSSTVSGRTATAGAEVGAPGDAITFALVGFSGAPTGATVNGVAATIQNETQTMVDVVLPALSTFVQGGAHETTEWNTTITVVVSEAGGSASDTLQIVSPDTDGPTYWFGTCALVDGTFPSPSSVFPPQAAVGDEYFVEVQTGTVTNVLSNGSIQASSTVFKVTSRIWDESANSGSGGWSLTRQVQFYAMDSLVAQHRNRRWAFKRV